MPETPGDTTREIEKENDHAKIQNLSAIPGADQRRLP